MKPPANLHLACHDADLVRLDRGVIITIPMLEGLTRMAGEGQGIERISNTYEFG